MLVEPTSGEGSSNIYVQLPFVLLFVPDGAGISRAKPYWMSGTGQAGFLLTSYHSKVRKDGAQAPSSDGLP